MAPSRSTIRPACGLPGDYEFPTDSAALLQLLFVVIAFASLAAGFLMMDFSVALVAQAVMVLCYRQETNGRSLEAIGADPAQHSTGAADVLPLH